MQRFNLFVGQSDWLIKFDIPRNPPSVLMKLHELVCFTWVHWTTPKRSVLKFFDFNISHIVCQ